MIPGEVDSCGTVGCQAAPCLYLPKHIPLQAMTPEYVSDTATCLLGGDRVTAQLETTGLISQK